MAEYQDTFPKKLNPGISHSFHRIKLPGDCFQSIPADNPPLDESKEFVDPLLATPMGHDRSLNVWVDCRKKAWRKMS